MMVPLFLMLKTCQVLLPAFLSFFEISCLLSLSSLVKIHRCLRASSFLRKYLRPERGVFFIKFIFFYFRKYSIISKFTKTNIPPPWHMAVGPNRHKVTSTGTVALVTVVANGG
jgi:hypothetical protein